MAKRDSHESPPPLRSDSPTYTCQSMTYLGLHCERDEAARVNAARLSAWRVDRVRRRRVGVRRVAQRDGRHGIAGDPRDERSDEGATVDEVRGVIRVHHREQMRLVGDAETA